MQPCRSNISFNWHNGFLPCPTRFPFSFRAPGFPAEPCRDAFPPPCGPGGCPINLDTSCVFYNMNQTQMSNLINLKLPNGTTAKIIFETIDAQLGQLNFNNWAIPFLRATYPAPPFGPINSLIAFGNAVDEQLELLDTAVIALQSGSTLSKTDSESIDITLTGPFNNNIRADLNISGNTGNRAIIESDGLFVAPQSLIPDYTNKTLTISDGNEVNIAAFFNSGGWLGNVPSDPSGAIDGQYWWNTTDSQLRIKVNGGVTKTITTS